MDETGLIISAKQGDEAAMESLFKLYIEYAVHLSYLIIRNNALAEDIAQESFIKAFRSLKKFDEARPFKPWFTRIVVNTSRTARKSSSRYVPLSEIDGMADSGYLPEEISIKKERQRLMLLEINKLDDKLRIPILLKYYSEMSEKEISSILKIPLTTVKSRLYTARQKLKERLLSREVV